MKPNIVLKRDLRDKVESVNIIIDRYLPRKDEYPKQIHKAMRHTLFAGGKRIRPYLAIRSYTLFDNDIKNILLIASAIELIHTYTLIHDDLPEIDNDDLRRGKPTCHILYGSDIALLAGDALLVGAIELVSTSEMDNAIIVKVIKEVCSYCGDKGIIAGQMADIMNEGKKVTQETLNFIHLNKTVKLFQLCTKLAGMTAKASAVDMKKLDRYGYCLGMAFQIIDDILDITGEQNTLGKTIGKDENFGKMTYPALYGLEVSKQKADELMAEADEIVDSYGEQGKYLKLLNQYIASRNN